MNDEPQTALAPRAGAALPDAFEREYMTGEGLVSYRDKMVAGWKMNTAIAAVAGLMVFEAVSTGIWGSVTIGVPLLLVLWLLFGVLRVSVSERAVEIKLGLFGPTIPMDAIESAQPIDYRWTAFGGWGIRRGPEGWMYNILGDEGRAVKIRWRDSKGQPQVTYVGTRTAEALAEAIERGRKALPPAAEPHALPADVSEKA